MPPNGVTQALRHFKRYTWAVAAPPENTLTSVFGERFPEDQLTVVSFIWPQPNSPDTYTIAPNPNLSLELDRHYPIRLARIALYDPGIEQSGQMLTELVSPQLTNQLLKGSNAADFMMSISFSLDNRLSLANLQIASPSTSPSIRGACAAMIRANSYWGGITAGD